MQFRLQRVNGIFDLPLALEELKNKQLKIRYFDNNRCKYFAI